jgi:protein TonB
MIGTELSPPGITEKPPTQPTIASTAVRMDPKHPLRIGDEFYPDQAIRSREEGRCIVQITVAADGRITAASIQTSAGFPRLDEACLQGVRGQRMLPATEDGKPVTKTVTVPITWRLKDR